MTATFPPPERDPEFRSPTRMPNALVDPPSPEEYQRLVANPFLAVLLFVGWLAALERASWFLGAVGSLVIILMLVVLVATSPYLLQFHCLDCGRTGPLARWRQHACEAVDQRRRLGRRPKLRPPAPPIQAMLWVYALFVAILVLRASGVDPAGWLP